MSKDNIEKGANMAKWNGRRQDVWIAHAINLKFDYWKDVVFTGLWFYCELDMRKVRKLFRKRPFMVMVAMVHYFIRQTFRMVLYYLCLPFVIMANWVVHKDL